MTMDDDLTMDDDDGEMDFYDNDDDDCFQMTEDEHELDHEEELDNHVFDHGSFYWALENLAILLSF